MSEVTTGRRSKNDARFAKMRQLVNEESLSRRAAARRVAESDGGSAASLNAGYSRYLERMGHASEGSARPASRTRAARSADRGDGDASAQFEAQRRTMESALLAQWGLMERVRAEVEAEIARLQSAIAAQQGDRDRLREAAGILGVELPE